MIHRPCRGRYDRKLRENRCNRQGLLSPKDGNNAGLSEMRED